ncbi:decaprenyl-phosphate phosphoribosyltransferase [Planctomycetota bacterium]|nr:decaprenyl-phosphate phosphoribosyltransferase [Planctomycetota bacterium]
MLLPAIKAMRPHQWVKNLLVFAPLLFTPKREDPAAWLISALAFAAFCCAASSIYLLNDIVDREEDRHHPKKHLRPIASGALSVGAAYCVLGLLLAIAAGLSMQLPKVEGFAFIIWPAAYLTLNLLYSFWWKRLVVVDCMCIALGFQLRVHAGAAAIGVDASHWIVLCTFFFALFLAFCKRYEELNRQAESSGMTRASLKDYSLPFLNMMIGPLAALSIVTYALYTVSEETIRRHHTDALMYTVPVVTYGVFRYLYLVYRKSEGGDPARLLFRDGPLVASGMAYVTLIWLMLRGH